MREWRKGRKGWHKGCQQSSQPVLAPAVASGIPLLAPAPHVTSRYVEVNEEEVGEGGLRGRIREGMTHSFQMLSCTVPPGVQGVHYVQYSAAHCTPGNGDSHRTATRGDGIRAARGGHEHGCKVTRDTEGGEEVHMKMCVMFSVIRWEGPSR